MKINQLKSGVVISYLTQIVNILSGLIYTPIMLRLLGQSEYGLYQLVYSVVSYLSLLSLGFGTGYIRFYSRYKEQGDEHAIAGLNGMFMIIFSVISLICLICGGFMTIRADLVFGSGLTDEELAKAKILMAIMVINMAITFINTVFKCNVTAHERFFFQRMIEFLRALFNPFLTLPLLIMGYGSVGMVVITTILNVLIFVLDWAYCSKKLKIKFCFSGLKFKLLKEVWIFTSFIFINMIVDQLNWSIDKFLLGRMIGTVAVAVYGVAGQLNSLYIMLANSISSVFVPRVNKIVAANRTDCNRELTTLFTKVGRMQFIILSLVISGYILFGREFIFYWTGKGYEEAYVIGLLLMGPATVPLIQNLGIEIQRAKNMHKVRSVVYLLIAVSNIFVSIPCIKIWGPSGAAVGTALSLFVGNCIFINWYYHFRIKLDIKYFWKQIFKFIPTLAVSCGVGLLIRYILPVRSVIILGVDMVLYCLVFAALMWLMGMNQYEKELVMKPLKKIGGRLCGK